jgi:hypothetical protein
MNAKIGRQYVWQSCASASRAVPVTVPESAQESTTLQRVVANRSGLGSGLIAAFGGTSRDDRVWEFFTQA